MCTSSHSGTVGVTQAPAGNGADNDHHEDDEVGHETDEVVCALYPLLVL